MAVTLHFKDGALPVQVANATALQPLQADDNFLMLMNASAEVVGLVPVASLEYATYEN